MQAGGWCSLVSPTSISFRAALSPGCGHSLGHASALTSRVFAFPIFALLDAGADVFCEVAGFFAPAADDPCFAATCHPSSNTMPAISTSILTVTLLIKYLRC